MWAIGYSRALMNQTYSDLAAIQRQALEDNGRGGQKLHDASTPWPTVTGMSAVPCRVAKTMRQLDTQIIESRLTVEGSFDICFPAGTDIRNKDRIQVTTLNNRVFKVIGPRYASDEISRIMACEEVT